MSTGSLPSLPGLDVQVERSQFYKTTIYETQSGREDRTSWMPSPRYRYSLKYNVLREAVSASAPYAAENEVSVLLKFLSDHYGSGDSFYYNDPYSNTSTKVRFADDTLKLTGVVNDVWECKFELVSVL